MKRKRVKVRIANPAQDVKPAIKTEWYIYDGCGEPISGAFDSESEAERHMGEYPDADFVAPFDALADKTDGQKENSSSEPDVSPCFNCSPETRMACCGCEKGIEWERTHKRAAKEEVYTPVVRSEEPCPCLKCSPEFRAACCGCEKGRKWEEAHKRSTN